MSEFITGKSLVETEPFNSTILDHLLLNVLIRFDIAEKQVVLTDNKISVKF
jgi:hypothetical protein